MSAPGGLLGWLPERWRRVTLEEVEDGLDRVANPILLKELRLMLRAKLFVGMHIATLLIAGIYLAGLLIVGWADRDRAGPGMAVDLGRTVFAAVIWIQTIAVFLLVPAITATLISAERERRTLDMLLSSAIRPGRVLAGKFLSSLGVMFVVMLTMFPLALASWVIGGVGFWQVIRMYVTQAMVGTAVVSACILISSGARASYQAIVGSYAAVALFGLLAAQFYGLFETWGIGPFAMELYGVEAAERPDFNLFWMTAREFWCGLAFPVFAWAMLVVLCVVGSLLAITPPHSARPAPLKLSYALILLGGIVVAGGMSTAVPGAQTDSFLLAVALALVGLFAGGALFAIEEVSVVTEGATRWPWPFRTGAQPGLAFHLATAFAGSVLLFAVFSVASGVAHLVLALLLGWACFCGGAAFLLRVAVRRSETVSALYATAMLVLAALPPIVDAILGGTFGGAEHNRVKPLGPVSAAASIVQSQASWGLWTGAGYLMAGVLMIGAALPLLARRRSELGTEPFNDSVPPG